MGRRYGRSQLGEGIFFNAHPASRYVDLRSVGRFWKIWVPSPPPKHGTSKPYSQALLWNGACCGGRQLWILRRHGRGRLIESVCYESSTGRPLVGPCSRWASHLLAIVSKIEQQSHAPHSLATQPHQPGLKTRRSHQT